MPEQRYWRVVVETREDNGNPFRHIYSHVPAATVEGAIDYALERYLGNTGGRNSLLDHWRPVGAWVADERHVSETFLIEPVCRPLFKRSELLRRTHA